MNAKNKKEIAKLSKMKLNELQSRFAEVTGKKTRCPNKTFLIRRITQVLISKDTKTKGVKDKIRSRIVDKQVKSTQAADCKVLPIRMNSRIVQKLDKARKRLGFNSRTKLFIQSLSEYLANAGEVEVAHLLSNKYE